MRSSCEPKRRACEPFRSCVGRSCGSVLWSASGGICAGPGLEWLCFCEVASLQDVVCERVPEHDGANLIDAADGQLPETPIAPAGMDAFADRAGFVLCFAIFAGH